jgi:hypothetical protein
MNCGACSNWNLRGSSLRVHGFGTCKADPNLVTRAGGNYAASHVCHIGRFEQAGAVTMARREQEKGRAR